MLREQGSRISLFTPFNLASPSQGVTPYFTTNQGEVEDVTPGQAGIRASHVPPCLQQGWAAKPCTLEQAS